MRQVLLLLIPILLINCGGPRKMVNIHFLSQADTNQGRALPLHVVPVDERLRHQLEGMSAEDWFVSDESENLTGIQKRVLRGAQNELMQMERRDAKNDFVVVVDFADVEGSDLQKIYLGNQYYKAKDLYVVVSKDRVRVVSKAVFNDYMKGN